MDLEFWFFVGIELIIVACAAVSWYASYCIWRDNKNGREVETSFQVVWGALAGGSLVVLVAWTIILLSVMG